MTPRSTLLFALPLLLLAGIEVAAMGPKTPKKDSQVSLVRPDPAPDPDAKGTLRIRSDKKGERFDVHIEKVDASLAHEVFLEDPDDSGLFEQIATLGDGGDLQLKIDTKKGDPLPLGVEKTDDLIGRRLEVRVDGDVVLKGTVPPYGLSNKPAKSKSDIFAPNGAPAPDMKATLKLRSKPDKGQERFDLKAKKVPWSDGPFRLFVEDGVASGTFVDVGDLEQKGSSEGRYRRDTKQGDALPLDASFVLELSGHALEVRDENGVVYLKGTIPAVE